MLTRENKTDMFKYMYMKYIYINNNNVKQLYIKRNVNML